MLGVPLHADDESRSRQAHRFDLSIGGYCLDAKSGGGTIDTLGVQRIDHHLGCAGERHQKSARGQRNAVGWSKWAVGGVLWRAVIESAGDLVHPLVQGTAKRHVQLLDTATDRQDW